MTDLDRLAAAARAVLATDWARYKARLPDETDRAAQAVLRAALEPELLEVYTVDRVEDADGALCLECSWQADLSSTSVPWSWPRERLHHEQVTGHGTQLFTYTPPGPSS